MNKIFNIVIAILTMIYGIVILVSSIADIQLPKPVLLILAIACIINAILIIINYKKLKDK